MPPLIVCVCLVASCVEKKKKRKAKATRRLVLVPLHVQGEVIRAGEGARADGALEGLGARVLPVVPGQLVRAGESPVAALPRAPVRLLTCGWVDRWGGRGREREKSLDE